jgi:hypothetical protein
MFSWKISDYYTIMVKENSTYNTSYVIGFLDCSDISLKISVNDSVSIALFWQFKSFTKDYYYFNKNVFAFYILSLFKVKYVYN